MSTYDPLFQQHLSRLARARLKRSIRVLDCVAAGRKEYGGKRLVDFCGNDYLGLSQHPALRARAREFVQQWGTGATASRLVCGTSSACIAIERKIAMLKQTEAALLLTSGWQANASILPALLRLMGTRVQVYVDRLAHASMHMGCQAAGVRQIRFRHNDLNHLESLLRDRANDSGPRVIITESVFSMDGDRCDVAALATLAERHGAFIYLDEAHATGVLGPQGMGLSALGAGRVDLAMGTFSKALGSFGAYVAGSRALCDYLANICSGFVFTTGLPPPVLGAIDAALDLIPSLEEARIELTHKAHSLRSRFHAMGLDTGTSDTHIVPVIVGDEHQAMSLGEQLERAAILVAPIRPPTVPRGSSRLRIALSSAHTQQDVDALVTALERADMVPQAAEHRLT